MKTYLSLLLLCFAFTAGAANYYFSGSTGDDNRTALQAQDQSTPWKTLNKLNAFFSSLQPGDSILFNRGDVFAGSLVIAASGTTSFPIVLAAYGTGSKPVINGLITLSNWQQTTNGIFQSECTDCQPDVNMVVINGVQQANGRYPNNGFLTIATHVGNTQVTSNQLTADPDWTGGEVVIRKNRWIIDRNSITQHAATTITYNTSSNYDAADGFGFFIQNHIRTLDQPGEWYFHTGEKKMYVYFGSADPASYTIQASATPTLVLVRNQSNIVFSDLIFVGANVNAFDMDHAGYIQIKNSDISFSGTNAIAASNSDYFTLENVVVKNTNNNAVELANCSYASITNNQIKNTGLFAGMGKSGDGSYQAILISGNNNTIAYNEIDSTGYIPITFNGNHTVIKNNYINYFAFTKDDGGGIYTWNNAPDAAVNAGRKITGNIVLNGIGAGGGTDNPAYLPANGIYMDDNSGSVEIASNTVANCAHHGLFIHNAHELDIEGNTLFNNGTQLYMAQDNYAPNSPIRNNVIKNNIFFSKTTTQLTAAFSSNSNDINQFGIIDSNYYCRPADDLLTLYTSYTVQGETVSQLHNLQSWQSAFGKDAASQKSPFSIPLYAINNLTGNNKFSNGNFDANIGGLYSYSPENNCVTSWYNGRGLDGGSLQISFNKLTQTNNHAYIIIGIGAVIAGKSYILKFSSVNAEQDKIASVFLRKSLSPYNDLSDRKSFVLSTTRNEHEFLFSPSVTEGDASIVLEVAEQVNPLWLDNIQLYEADVTMFQPDDFIRFEYNAGKSSKSISLDEQYADVQNKKYVYTVPVASYSSIILMKPFIKTLPVQFIHFEGQKSGAKVNLQWQASNEAEAGYFDVERSANGIDFIKLAGILAKHMKGGRFNYTYEDSDPVAGTNYYRIKCAAGNSSYVYSKIISISYTKSVSLEISPNPASDKVNIAIKTTASGRKAHLSIEGISGNKVETIPLTLSSQVITVDVSSWSKGVYIARLYFDNEVLLKKFMKQ